MYKIIHHLGGIRIYINGQIFIDCNAAIFILLGRNVYSRFWVLYEIGFFCIEKVKKKMSKFDNEKLRRK